MRLRQRVASPCSCRELWGIVHLRVVLTKARELALPTAGGLVSLSGAGKVSADTLGTLGTSTLKLWGRRRDYAETMKGCVGIQVEPCQRHHREQGGCPQDLGPTTGLPASQTRLLVIELSVLPTCEARKNVIDSYMQVSTVSAEYFNKGPRRLFQHCRPGVTQRSGQSLLRP